MASKRGNRSCLDRAFGYDAKMDPTRIGGVVEAERARMVNNFASATEDLFTVEIDCKAYLGNAGISPVLYPSYLAFAKQIYRLKKRGYQGATLTNEVTAKGEVWVGRGNVAATLNGVAALQGVTVTIV